MNDSYAATRIHVMRTKLISPEEYDRLLKMSDREVINYLQSTEYREDVDALAIKDLEDLEVVDKILTRNDERMLRKLRRISGRNFQMVLGQVLLRNDLWNLTVIAEAIEGKKDPKDALERYGKMGTLDPAQFVEARTVQELARMAAEHVPGIDAEVDNLAAFTSQLAARRGIEGGATKLATDAYLVDEQNLLNLVRLKRDRLSPERITALFMRGGRIPFALLEKAAKAATLKDALETLRQTEYAAVIGNALDALEEDTLVRFEQELHKAIAQRIRRITRLRPLGVEILINYLTEKDIERVNLRLLIKGKRLGLDEDFIREHLVA